MVGHFSIYIFFYYLPKKSKILIFSEIKNNLGLGSKLTKFYDFISSWSNWQEVYHFSFKFS